MRRLLPLVVAALAGACLAQIDESRIQGAEPTQSDGGDSAPSTSATTAPSANDAAVPDDPGVDADDPLLAIDGPLSCAAVVATPFFFCSTMESGAQLLDADFGVGGSTIFDGTTTTSAPQALRATVVGYADAASRGAFRQWVGAPQPESQPRLSVVTLYVNVRLESNPMPRTVLPSLVTLERSDGLFNAPENIVHVGLAIGADHSFIHASTTSDTAGRTPVGPELPPVPIGVWRRLRIRLTSASDTVRLSVSASEAGKPAEHLIVGAPIPGATTLGRNTFVSLGIVDVSGTNADGVVLYDDMLVTGR